MYMYSKILSAANTNFIWTHIWFEQNHYRLSIIILSYIFNIYIDILIYMYIKQRKSLPQRPCRTFLKRSETGSRA